MNLADAQALIQQNPQEANSLAQKWAQLSSQFPDIENLETDGEWAVWHDQHSDIENVWDGRIVTDAYFSLAEQHEEQQMQTSEGIDQSDIPSALLALPFLALAFRDQTKLMEENSAYQKIIEQKKKDWLKDNPGKDAKSKEFLDYCHGSLYDNGKSLLHKQAESDFRSGKDLGQNPSERKLKKRNKIIEKYDKEKKGFYKNKDDDPAIYHTQLLIEEEANARYESLKKQDKKLKLDDVRKQVAAKEWDTFVQRHPQKAEEYSKDRYKKTNADIKAALARIEEKRQIEEKGKQAQEQAELKHNQQEQQGIHDTSTQYQQTTGKEIHYVEKKRQDISVEEASKRLESIKPPKEPELRVPDSPQPSTSSLIDLQGRPLSSTPTIKNEEGQKQNADSLPHEIRLSKQRFTRFTNAANRTLGRGINKFNNVFNPRRGINRIGNSLAKQAGKMALRAGSRMATQAGASAIAATSEIWGPILIGVIAILFIIVIIAVIFFPGNTPTPINGNVLDYAIPFRDKTILPVNPENAKEQVKKEFPSAQFQYWDKIIQQSQQNGWNPAFVLTLWIEETGASQYTTLTMGGGGIAAGTNLDGSPFYANGHLGCAPLELQTIDESLRCLFKNFGTKYTTTQQFEAFMRKYSGEKNTGPFKVNPNFPNRVKRYYSILVPNGIIPVTPAFSASGNFIGVNMFDLPGQDEDRIKHILGYLSGSCGTTVIRTRYLENDPADLKTLLDLGQQYNIRFIIALADYPNRGYFDISPGSSPFGWYKDIYQKDYLPHVKTVVSAFKDHPAVYGWELANEPHCGGDASCGEPYHNWVTVMSAAIRSFDPNPNHLISIGTQANNDIQYGDSVGNGEYEKNNSVSWVGALTGHYYNGTIYGLVDPNEFAKQKQNMLKEIEIAKKLNKPFYIGEGGFLCANPSSCPMARNDQNRADVVKQELTDIFNTGATGYLLWQYGDRVNNTLGSNDVFTFYENDPICPILKDFSQKTSPPNNTPGNIQPVQFATQLVNSIQTSCSDGRVSNNNYSCLQKLAPPAPQSTLDQFIKSTLSNFYLQCVGFIQGVISGITGQSLDNGGNAIDFASNIPTGYRFINKLSGNMIQEADIPIWQSGVYGHIAFVTKVFDANTFQVAEANADTRGGVGYRIRTIDDPRFVGWLRKL